MIFPFSAVYNESVVDFIRKILGLLVLYFLTKSRHKISKESWPRARVCVAHIISQGLCGFISFTSTSRSFMLKDQWRKMKKDVRVFHTFYTFHTLHCESCAFQIPLGDASFGRFLVQFLIPKLTRCLMRLKVSLPTVLLDNWVFILLNTDLALVWGHLAVALSSGLEIQPRFGKCIRAMRSLTGWSLKQKEKGLKMASVS